MQKSRLSQYKQARLVEHLVAGTTARTAASLCGVHRNTAAYYFLRLREIIAYELEAVDLSRFDAAPLIAFTATKETDYGTETNRRI